MRLRPVYALLAALVLASPPASANFHLMKVVEVFGGTTLAPNAQYVVIQMYTGGQNVVASHKISIYNASGTLLQDFVFANSVGNGAAQDKILIGTAEAQTLFNVTPDLLMSSALIPVAGGKACFDALPEDCVAWGNYTGSATGIGTPVNALSGLIPGEALIRRLDIVAPNTTLQSNDDTDECASDFFSGRPAPRNNARVNGTIPPSTCGNGTVEGLEACDGGSTCSAGCTVALFHDGFE